MVTGLQAVYKSQVSKTIASLETAREEAIFLHAKSHDNSWEKGEAAKMVMDIEDWLRCWKDYSEVIRRDPNKIFNY